MIITALANVGARYLQFLIGLTSADPPVFDRSACVGWEQSIKLIRTSIGQRQRPIRIERRARFKSALPNPL
ncbi:hypothetical protein [Methylobacterium sp.]|jgi:hypothetical protein|uniref:hypothetical protein n=1 Tax=Methylobacterium sp. TaxID=409 RepID=UPI0025EE2DC8|nr:hypothetical protein [Methylobacterium sp.]MBY0260452.1 hypothetical protein [Methylobacterium sp.]